jgi:dTMP kinase
LSRRRGCLVAVEGIDGAGKSTLVRTLARSLRRAGWTVAVRREPADRELGALAQAASARDPWTGGVYFTVDRQLARPAVERDLAAHDVVLTDRSFYSTMAYQGSALPPAGRRRLERLQREAAVRPDRVILLDVSPEAAVRRVGRRGGGRGPLERYAVLRRVTRAYRALSGRTGWIVLDATAPPSSLAADALARLRPAIGRPSRRPAPRRRR